jgi:NADH-quinone oxidoreductase subunit M
LSVAFAGLSIILAAVYTLNMIRNVFYGSTNTVTENAVDLRITEKLALGIIVVLIFVLGVYPQLLMGTTTEITESIIKAVKGTATTGAAH